MIQDIINNNEEVQANDKQLAILKEHFPSCFKKDGSFDIERFKSDISDKTDVISEGYELKFLGKSYAKLLASTDTTTIIKPNDDHNSLPENTNSENIYISGDNLDGLKHLLKSYHGKIKCIYIDPPYNTGSDGFVYQDNFNYTIENLQEKLSVSEDEANRILDLTRRGSASHSAWLMFMYSRLLLARDLLTDDGVIFISIDDNEQANLKLLCDDIFGEENFITSILWKRKKEISNDSKNIAVQGEYILSYSRTTSALFKLEELSQDYIDKSYNDPNEEFPLGKWRPVPITVSKGLSGGGYKYKIKSPAGKTHERVWAYPEDSYLELVDNGRIYYGKAGDAIPQRVIYEDESDGRPISNYWDNVATNKEGKKEILSIFGDNVFSTPKPTNLIVKLITIVTNQNDIILDFFSGSASSAHAVMIQNSIEEEGNRKIISVQLPEIVSSDNKSQKIAYDFLKQNGLPLTLDYIGIERIKRAAVKIKEENPDKDLDLGFKHYILVEPNQNTLDKLESFDKASLIVDSNIIDDFGKSTILSTWLNADGYGLSVKAETIDLAGYTAYYYDKHLYFIDTGFKLEHMKALLGKYDSEGDFNPENLVLFGYSFPDWSINEMVEKNLRILNDSEKNLKINLAVRY